MKNAVVGVLVGIVGIWSLVTYLEGEKTTLSNKDKQEASAVMEQAFIEGCTEEGTYSYCTCVWSELESNMSVEEITTWALSISDDATDAEIFDNKTFRDSVLACI